MLALSNRRWKLPDDQFGAFLEHYVADLPHFNLGLVVKKSEYFPYIMDVDKSATKGASVGSPDEGAERGCSGSQIGGRGYQEAVRMITRTFRCCTRTL